MRSGIALALESGSEFFACLSGQNDEFAQTHWNMLFDYEWLYEEGNILSIYKIDGEYDDFNCLDYQNELCIAALQNTTLLCKLQIQDSKWQLIG